MPLHSLGDILRLSTRDYAAAQDILRKLVVPWSSKIVPSAHPGEALPNDPDYFEFGFFPGYLPGVHRESHLRQIVETPAVSNVHFDPDGSNSNLEKALFAECCGSVDEVHLVLGVYDSVSDPEAGSPIPERGQILVDLNRPVYVRVIFSNRGFDIIAGISGSVELNEEKPLFYYLRSIPGEREEVRLQHPSALWVMHPPVKISLS